MINTKKAQASIEVVIIVIFIIVFLIVFNNLSKDTVKTLEKDIILQQENEIANSLYSFLKVQESLVSSDFNISFKNSFNIPQIKIPSKNVQCKVFITPKHITIDVYDNEIITLDKNVSLDFTKINFSEVIIKSCGDEIFCENINNMVECS